MMKKFNKFCDSNLDYIRIKEKPNKGLTPDQKKLHWEAYAKKTERQEEVFQKVFESLFEDQKDYVTAQFGLTGKLPEDLNDSHVAKRFEPAIEIVYHEAFESAV